MINSSYILCMNYWSFIQRGLIRTLGLYTVVYLLQVTHERNVEHMYYICLQYTSFNRYRLQTKPMVYNFTYYTLHHCFFYIYICCIKYTISLWFGWAAIVLVFLRLGCHLFRKCFFLAFFDFLCTWARESRQVSVVYYPVNVVPIISATLCWGVVVC